MVHPAELVLASFIVAVSLISNTIVSLLNLIDLNLSGEAFMVSWRVLCALALGYLVFFSARFCLITVWFKKHKLNLK